MKKFTVEEHQERMRRILNQSSPVDRTQTVTSLLSKVKRKPSLKPLPKVRGIRGS